MKEAYLGDIPDQPLIVGPKTVFRSRRRDAIERFNRAFVTVAGIGFHAVLWMIVLAMAAATFVAQNRAHGQAVKIPEACAALVRLVGLPPAPTLEQAEWAIAELMKPEHSRYPGVQRCRAAVAATMPKRRN